MTLCDSPFGDNYKSNAATVAVTKCDVSLLMEKIQEYFFKVVAKLHVSCRVIPLPIKVAQLHNRLLRFWQRTGLYIFWAINNTKNICDCMGCHNGSNGTPLDPPLFWLHITLKKTVRKEATRCEEKGNTFEEAVLCNFFAEQIQLFEWSNFSLL